MENEELIRLTVKGPRRVAALVSLGLLGAIVLRLALFEAVSPGGQALLLGIAALVLYGAWRLFQATEVDLVLTTAGLVDAQGRILADIDNIDDVETGLFAVKPPSGFALRLKEPMPAAWAPGVWWRMGRRLGIGGAIPAPEAKALAQMIAVLVAKRRGELPDL